jgi:hypothetical protein
MPSSLLAVGLANITFPSRFVASTPSPRFSRMASMVSLLSSRRPKDSWNLAVIALKDLARSPSSSS